MDQARHIVSTNASMEGSQIGGQVVLFGRDGDLFADTVVTYSFAGTNSVQHLLTNLLAGQTYEVIAGGSIALVAASAQGTLEFTTPVGVGAVTVVADRPGLINLVVHAPSQVPAGENFTATIDVVDAAGNLQTNFTGSVALARLGSAGGRLHGVTQVAVQNGVGTFSLLSLSAAGTYTLASFSSSGGVFGSATTITAVPVPLAARFVVAGDPTSIVGGTTFNITVTALDAFNHVETSFAGTVEFTSTDTQFGRPDDYVFTAADRGSHTFSVSLNTVGMQSIRVADVTYPSARGTSRRVQVSAKKAATMVVTAFRLMDEIGGAAEDAELG
jgi:hypothetical protein